MADSKYVMVAGATGSQGGAVVRALLSRGHKVRAMTRNVESPGAAALKDRGVEVVAGDFGDPKSLVKAVSGVDAVYGMSTPFEKGVEAETTQGVALLEAVKEAGVGHFVFSSVGSADKGTGIPHFDSKYEVEKKIAQSGVDYTIVAPVFFMDNLVSPFMLPMLKEGKVVQAMPGDRELQQVAVDDIGGFAATMIERGKSVYGKRFDIAGDGITGARAAEVLTDASGKKIEFQELPLDVMRSQSEDMALMYEWFDRVGYSVDFGRLREEFPEVSWHSFESWAGNQDWSVLDR
ncbi:MAG: NmrA/HSCARG family protein [Planctomycetota bacterium]